MGEWIERSLVPSSKVASTCTVLIIDATPGSTWRRPMSCWPSTISSATDLPSRIISIICDEMSATASGWLSLHPRASRRCASWPA
eukprot:scaffold7904_cov103-Isochrysis_galbana.AAC.8